jgi:hypothetical protein
MCLQEVDQHADEAVDGVGDGAVGRPKVSRDGEKCPKDKRVAVEQV